VAGPLTFSVFQYHSAYGLFANQARPPSIWRAAPSPLLLSTSPTGSLTRANAGTE
jgi:hypothetical protein